MNQTWPIIHEIKSEPHKIDDGNLFCWGVDVVMSDWGNHYTRTLYFCSKSQASSIRLHEEYRG